MSERSGSSDDLTVPFIFVPKGDPEPTEWMAAHPHWIKIPATLVPRRPAAPPPAAPHRTGSVAIAGTAAAVAPGIAGDLGAEIVAGAEALAAKAGTLAAQAGTVAAGAAEGAFAGLNVLLYPSQTASREQDELPRGHEGFNPPAALPQHPGLAPPVAGDPRSAVGVLTPAAPLPPQPGFHPAPPPTVLPGRKAVEQGPTIFRQDRNDGLAGGSRTKSQRAREAARVADPTVTQALSDAEWRAHHLINVAGLRVAPDLIAAAARAGWRTDDPANVAALPASPDAQQKLKTAGINRPVHDSGHQNWNAEVRDQLETILRKLRNERGRPGIKAYDRHARQELEKLQSYLRKKMMQKNRLTQDLLEEHTNSA